MQPFLSLFDMELFGVNDRPQKQAEIVLVALGEAGFGDDVGIRLGYVEKIVVGGFGDLLDAVIGEGSGLSVDCVVRQPVLGEAVGNGCAPLCDPFGSDLRREENEEKADLHDNRACEYKAVQGGSVSRQQMQPVPNQPYGVENAHRQEKPMAPLAFGAGGLMLGKCHERVVGAWGRIFDFHGCLLSNGVHYIRHQKMAKPFGICEKS